MSRQPFTVRIFLSCAEVKRTLQTLHSIKQHSAEIRAALVGPNAEKEYSDWFATVRQGAAPSTGSIALQTALHSHRLFAASFAAGTVPDWQSLLASIAATLAFASNVPDSWFAQSHRMTSPEQLNRYAKFWHIVGRNLPMPLALPAVRWQITLFHPTADVELLLRAHAQDTERFIQSSTESFGQVFEPRLLVAAASTYGRGAGSALFAAEHAWMRAFDESYESLALSGDSEENKAPQALLSDADRGTLPAKSDSADAVIDQSTPPQPRVATIEARGGPEEVVAVVLGYGHERRPEFVFSPDP